MYGIDALVKPCKADHAILNLGLSHHNALQVVERHGVLFFAQKTGLLASYTLNKH